MCNSTSNKVLSDKQYKSTYVCRDTNASKNMIKLFKMYPERPLGYNEKDKVLYATCTELNDKTVPSCLI